MKCGYRCNLRNSSLYALHRVCGPCRPIHCAIVNGHLHIVRELLLCGADITTTNGAGRTGLQLATGRQMRQLIRGELIT